MAPEEKLDAALRHLLKYNHGSYMYLRKIHHCDDENWNYPKYKNDKDGWGFDRERKTRLIYRLEELNIKESEHLPIINHLIRDGYVDPFYGLPGDDSTAKNRQYKLLPKQIRITYAGMIFIGKQGGYQKEFERLDILATKDLNDAEISRFTKETFPITERRAKWGFRVGLAGAILGVVGSSIGIYQFVETRQTDVEPSNNYETIPGDAEGEPSEVIHEEPNPDNATNPKPDTRKIDSP